MRGRNTVDPELARLVEQRLERLLAERGPRRAIEAPGDRHTAGGVAIGSDDDRADDRADGRADADAPALGRLVTRRRASAGPPSAARQQDIELDEELREEPDGDSDAAAAGRAGGAGGRRRGRAAVAGSEPAPAVASRSGFGRAHLIVVGVLVLVGVLLGGWAVLRARPVPLPPAAAAPRTAQVSPSPSGPGTPGSGSAPPGGASTPAAGPSAAPGLVVHVLGAVKRPVLVELAAGARVQDAIEAAGGLRPGARLGDLNLAQTLADGQQLVIGQTGDESELRGGAGSTSGTAPGAGGAAPPAALLDLNAASVGELETLPGVGPVTAAKIVAWREEHGRFSRIEELQEVAGIGPKTYAEIAPHVRV